MFIYFIESHIFVDEKIIIVSGAALHLHDSSLVDVWWLVKNATYMDNCYMCFDSNKQLHFKFSKTTPTLYGIMFVVPLDKLKNFV